jgi:hypothetical protein
LNYAASHHNAGTSYTAAAAAATAGQLLRQKLLEPGGSIEPYDLLTAAFGGQEASSKVLIRQQPAGWSPNPASLLQSLSQDGGSSSSSSSGAANVLATG